MPRLLDSICSVIGVFYKYAKRDRDCFTLNRRELKRMIQKEFSEVLQDPCDPQTIELVMQLLDLNGDCLVDLNEFVIFVLQVAKACYSYLQPRECLPQQGDTRGTRCDRDPQRDERACRQPWDNGEERNDAYERGGSDQTRPRPADSSTRRVERREYLAPVLSEGQYDERSHQARNPESSDNRGRVHQSREAQEQEDDEGLPHNPEPQADVETHRRAGEPEPQRNEAGHCQLRKQETTIEEKPQRQSWVLEPRDGRHYPSRELQQREEDRAQFSQEPTRRVGHNRQHRLQESEQRVGEDNLRRPREFEPWAYEERSCRRHAPREVRYDYGRCPPSHDPQAWEDERRENYPRGEVRRQPYDLYPCEDEWGCYQPYGHEPIDNYEEPYPLPRTGSRWEPEAREDDKRGQRYYASERGERRRPHDAELSEGERRRLREAEPHKGERRRPHEAEPNEGERRRPRGAEPSEGERRRPREAEPSEGERRWPREAEPSEAERRWPHEAEPSEGERRRPHNVAPSEGERRRPHNVAPSEGERRRHHEAEPSEGERRRPREAELSEGERRRPHEAEPSEGERRRPRDPEPSEGERRRPRNAEPSEGERRRPHEAEPSEGGRRRPREAEPRLQAPRDGGQRRQQYYVPETLETDSRWRRPQLYEPEPREGERRRPQPSEHEPREEDQARPRDDDRKRPQSREPLTREDVRGQRLPRDSQPREDERRRSRSREPESRESESTRSEVHDPRGEDEPRSQYYYGPKPREREQDRYYHSHESNPRKHDQSRPLAYEYRDSEWRTYEPEYIYNEQIYYEREPREDEWSRPQRLNPKTREGERRRQEPHGSELDNVRQPQPHEPESRQEERSRTHVPREPDSREGERNRPGYYAKEEEHESRLASRDLEHREGDQRRTQSCQSELQDGEHGQVPQENALGEDEQTSYMSHKKISRDTKNGRQQAVQEEHQQSQQRESEPTEGEQTRSHQYKSEQSEVDQRRSQDHDPQQREVDQRRSQPHETEQREADQRRSQPHDTEQREDDQRRSQQRDTPQREDEQRRSQQRDTQQREDEQRRSQQNNTEQREVDQRRSQQHDTQHREADQRRFQQYKSESREREQRRPQNNEGKPTESEQRRPPSCGTPAMGERRRIQATDPGSSAYAQQRQQLCKPNAEEGDMGRPQQPCAAESREGEQRAEKPRASGPCQNVQTGQGEQESPLPWSRRVERSQTRGPESQRREQRRQEEPGSRTQQTTEVVQRPPSGEPKPDPRAVAMTKGSKTIASKGTQEQSGTPEPEQHPVPDASIGEGGGQSGPMETDGSSPQVQELQTPLEEENQAASKNPLRRGQSNPEACETKASPEKPEIPAEAKVPVVCNPLYEYLVAQKK